MIMVIMIIVIMIIIMDDDYADDECHLQSKEPTIQSRLTVSNVLPVPSHSFEDTTVLHASHSFL